MKRAYILFTRVPEAGKTKTRMMPYLSGEECARLHSAFLRDIYLRTRDVDADVFVCYTPFAKNDEARKLFPGAVEFFPQTGADLGEKMARAIAHVLSEGYDRVVLTGSDLPELDAEVLDSALDRLDSCDIVLNPTSDGGYYLVGMKAFHDIFRLPRWGDSSVFDGTVKASENAGLSVAAGRMLDDIDCKEDLKALKKRIADGAAYLPSTELFLETRDCIGCNLCTKSCTFLKKHSMNLRDFAVREDLAYHCFLCGRCTAVCPKGIDGQKIARLMRRRKVLESGGMPMKKYLPLRLEKNPYKFRNYRFTNGNSALFTGCNFPSFFPETTDRLVRLFREYGIGTIHDCCSKPIYEIGLIDDSDRSIGKIGAKLKEKGITELIFLCPNCYYFLRGRLDVKMVTIYEKLAAMKLGNVLSGKVPYYAPCPDRVDRVFQNSLKHFVPDGFTEPLKKLQCCGLGGCAVPNEPGLSREMARTGGTYPGKFYTACASCAGNFRRTGNELVEHILMPVLGMHEVPPDGKGTLFARAKWRLKRPSENILNTPEKAGKKEAG